ncbi:MAG: DUF1934 domain-containing protein [Clostridia bacterium]|nr:DUF1934 domain-containing protein [Clostridia bacterium]
MPGTPILLSLQASSSAEGEQRDGLQLLTSGELTALTDGYLIRYEEIINESAAPTKVELSLKEGIVTMQRKGEFESNLVFRKGRRYESQYVTPFGLIELALYCTEMRYGVDKQGGFLQLQYQLDLNGQFEAMHEMDMRFAIKESDE